MRIGIFGGSFNPPHKGHRLAARTFCRQAELDRLLVIPAGTPPHKALESACTGAQRLAMARLNFRGMPCPVTVSDMEIQRQGKSYTVETLRQLKAQYPNDSLFLYCGSDMLLSFDTWFCYREILSLCTLCVMRREDQPAWEEKLKDLASASPTPLRILEGRPLVESSTNVRTQLRQGKKPQGLCAAVAAYIQKEGLYR